MDQGGRAGDGVLMVRFSPQDYDAWYETPLGSLCDRLEKEAIFSLFKPKGLVLDIGCGTGNYTLELARRGTTTVGVDSSFKMAAFAKRKSERENLHQRFVVADAEAMPFKSGVFDSVLGITTLCFVHNPENAVVEMARVLEPGGSLVLGELNKMSYWAALRRVKALFKKSSYRWARFFSFKKLNLLLKEAGFKDLRLSSCLYFPPINSKWLLRGYRFFENPGKALFPKNGAFITITGKRWFNRDTS